MPPNIFAPQTPAPPPPGQANIFRQAGPRPYQPTESALILGEVSRAYPGIAKHLGNAVVQWGKTTGPEDDRQLEYYPPWESDNPNPGKNTVELYNKDIKGQDLTDSVALDMLHYLGSVDPRTQQPVDPQYYEMKRAMVDQIKQRKAPMDLAGYAASAKNGPAGTYDEYLQRNRVDAYIRAMVSPRLNPDWQRPGIFTPEMQAIGEKIRAYISAHPEAQR